MGCSLYQVNGKVLSHPKTIDLRKKIAILKKWRDNPFMKLRIGSSYFKFNAHHHFPLQLQNQLFYDGLTQQRQYIVDNVVGGAMREKQLNIHVIFKKYWMQISNRNVQGERHLQQNELGFKAM